MPPRSVTYALIGFALLLLILFLTTRFPGSRVFEALTYSQDKSWETAEEDLEEITIALGRYHTTARAYPTTEQGLAALVSRPEIPPIPPNWSPKLEEVPLDPWKQPYVYRLMGKGNAEYGLELDLFSLGPDGVESDDDIIAEIRL